MTDWDGFHKHVSNTPLSPILSEFSKNCFAASEKLLILLADRKVPFSTCYFIKALLELNEKILPKKNYIPSGNQLIKNLRIVLNLFTAENSRLDDNVISDGLRKCILSILGSAIRIGGNEEELLEMLSLLSTSIRKMLEEGDKSKELMFQLEILTVMYRESCPGTCRFAFENDISKLIMDLIFESNDDKIAMQTIVHLIPAFVMFVRSGDVVENFWKKMVQSELLKFERTLIMLCKCFNICFSKSSPVKDSGFVIIEDPIFWHLLVKALESENPTFRKQGRYLLQEAVSQLERSGQRTHIKSSDRFFYNSELKHYFVSRYQLIIKILEFLEEQQFHIIEPIFKDVLHLEESICNGTCDLSWILMIYRRIIFHESMQVSRWGLSNFFKLPEEFFSEKYIAIESSVMLANSLSNPNFYYSDGFGFSEELKEFFKKRTNSKIFFSHFIQTMCSKIWSPETLFFVIHSLSGVGKASVIEEKELLMLKTFVLKAFQTHDVAIRIGSQVKLLSAASDLINPCVSLKSVFLFLSSFPTKEVVKVDSSAWDCLVRWMRTYPKEQFKNVIEIFEAEEAELEFNEKSMALALALFYWTHERGLEVSFALEWMKKVLALFSEVNKRPYCDKLLYDRYVSIFYYFCKITQPAKNVKKAFIHHLGDVVSYICTQLRQISSLKDFNTCEFYLSALEIILDKSVVDDLFEEITNEFYGNLPPIGLYWRMFVLRGIFENKDIEPKLDLLEFIAKNLNKCLNKEHEDSETSLVFRKLWGVMNSKFLCEKWKIFGHLVNARYILPDYEVTPNRAAYYLSTEKVIELSTEACLNGGKEILSPVLYTIKGFGPRSQIIREGSELMLLIWKEIELSFCGEQRRVVAKNFIQTFFEFPFNFYSSLLSVTLKITDSLFSGCSFDLINIFMEYVQNFISFFLCGGPPKFCEILIPALNLDTYRGKNEKLKSVVCLHIQKLKICSVGEVNGYLSMSEISARAVLCVLKLNRSYDGRRMAGILVEKLPESLENLTGSSLHEVNRLKLRITQTLLLLEPMLAENEKPLEKLFDWVFKSLTKDNLQPGVRRLQEWLLIRMLLRHSSLFTQYKTLNEIENFWDIGKKGLCSLIVVSFHLCNLIASDIERISSEMNALLSFFFHQNFEVRLHALVVFQELFNLALDRNLEELTNKYEAVYIKMKETLEKSLKGNVSKNAAKLMDDFYIKKFNPLFHYSLETIYMDLPKLANVDPDEWISMETFEYCGLKAEDLKIFPKKKVSLLTDAEDRNWSTEDTEDLKFNAHDYEVSYQQKKIIPLNSLFPSWNEDGSEDLLKQSELIVVASLVDRIPNLGGLARSCEVFGASEFVIHSYKHVQDQQFSNLSVTAEKWINIKEVRCEMLFDYLTELHVNGYTIIGLEQAVNSRSLGSAAIPKKSVILLGNEKKGIPPDLLPLLDMCIEIPQLGKIRSLNVHVAGALFMWEYGKQNKLF